MLKESKTGLLLSIFLCLVLTQVGSGRIIYVDANAPGTNNGSSWADAFNFLQDALAGAQSGDEIRVAQGTYRPDEDTNNPNGTGDRKATFQLINGVILKGGYAGFGESDPNARDIELYETILSGDLLDNDVEIIDINDLAIEASRSDNSYHVVTASYTNNTTILDGFNVTAGYANSDGYESAEAKGGGIFNNNGSPAVINCIFTGNYAREFGGGMYNYNNSQPIVTNCLFSTNMALFGGGISNENSSSPHLDNCTFRDNIADSEGGGMSNYVNSSPTLKNCFFYNNKSYFGGGGLDNYESNPKIENCEFHENWSDGFGGGMSNIDSNPTIVNCSFISNKSETDGSGIYINDSYSGAKIYNCVFTANIAEESGGAVNVDSYYYYSYCILSGCIFENNSASYGGGVCNSESISIINNCAFFGNSAERGGANKYLFIKASNHKQCFHW